MSLGDSLRIRYIVLIIALIYIPECQAKIPKKRVIQCGLKCDQNQCPTIGSVKVEDCPEDLILYDVCGCCRRCNITAPAMKAVTTQEEACRNIKCSKKEICVLNIQGLPICRCPSEQMCRRYNSQFDSKMKFCGTNGESYPSRCHLQVASCKLSRKIRIDSPGPCPVNTTSVGENVSSGVKFTPISPESFEDSGMLRGSLASIGNGQSSRNGKLRDLSTKELRRLRRKGGLSLRETETVKQLIRSRNAELRTSTSKFSRALSLGRRHRLMRKALA